MRRERQVREKIEVGWAVGGGKRSNVKIRYRGVSVVDGSVGVCVRVCTDPKLFLGMDEVTGDGDGDGDGGGG